MRSIVKYVFVAMLIMFAGCAGTEEYNNGKFFLEHGDYAMALRTFEKALKKNPGFAKDKVFQDKLVAAKCHRAEQLFWDVVSSADSGGTVEGARIRLEETARLDPHNRKVQFSLKSIAEPESGGGAGKVYAEGIAYYDKKNWYKAMTCFAQTIELQMEHIPARIKRFECTKPINKADEQFQLGTRLVDEKRLAAAVAALKESMAISPFHPEAGEVLEAVEKKKAKAQDLYGKGKESAEKADWNTAEKAFTAAIDIWSDYEEARQGLVGACLKQADIYEDQGLSGHEFVKVVVAMKAKPSYEGLSERARKLRDQLLDSVGCRVGLLVTDAGGDGRKAGKVEAGILSAEQKYLPNVFKIATREEMQISEISPEYLIMCKVIELDAATEKSTEEKSERIKVGTKNVPNPNYFKTKEAYERASSQAEYFSRQSRQTDLGPAFGLVAGLSKLGSDMAVSNTPMYIEEDVYETRHFAVGSYYHSASISLSTRITEPASSSLVDSIILSDTDSETSDKEYGVDLLSPLTQSSCEQVCQKVAFGLAKAHSEKFLDAANMSVRKGQTAIGVENCVKVLLIAPEQVSETVRWANQVIETETESKDFASSLIQLGFTSTIRHVARSKLGSTAVLGTQRTEIEERTVTGFEQRSLKTSTSTPEADRLGLQVRELDQVEKKSLEKRMSSAVYQKALRMSSVKPWEGVVIINIRQGSKAEQRSLNVGDIIIKFDNKAIRNVADYRRAVNEADLNRDIFILIIRNNNAHYIKL